MKKYLSLSVPVIAAMTVLVSQPANAQITNLTDFAHCIAWNGSSYGYGSQCWLAPNPAPGSYGVWDVDTALEIGRSVEIVGTTNAAYDVILRRSSTLGSNCMIATVPHPSGYPSCAVMYTDGGSADCLVTGLPSTETARPLEVGV